MRKLVIATLIALASAQAVAESRITAVPASSSGLSASAKLNIAVNVPRILYLRVGATGATVNNVTFTAGFTGLGALPISDAVFSGAIPSSASITAGDDNGASDGQIPVQLWTNNGSATLDCSGADLTSGSNTIPKSDISVSSSGTLAHPGTSLACVGALRGSSGVNDLNDTWTYAYAPTTLPAAGDYQTTITYTASQP